MDGDEIQAMIFAAGMGTRLKPLTDRIPKALVQVGGKPLLEHVILRLKAAGGSRIVINVHHFANQIINYLSCHDFQMDIRVSDESASLLNTGGGLKKARPFFNLDSPVLIHNVDVLSNVDLKGFYKTGESCMGGAVQNSSLYMGNGNGEDKTRNHPVDALLLVSQRKTKRYLVFNDDMRLVGWTNIETGEVKSPYSWVRESLPKLHLFAFSGIHLFSPRLFPLMDEWPDEFPIMDFYLKNCDKVFIRGYVQDHLQLMDVGKQETLAKAEEFLEELKKGQK